MPSLIHEATAATVCSRYPGAQTRHFARAMRGLYELVNPLDPGDCECESTCECASFHSEALAEFLTHFRFKPDVFLVGHEEGRVICWEVTVSHGLTSKEGRYIDAFWALDDTPYQLALVQVDAGGRETAIDLLGISMEALRQNAEAPTGPGREAS